MGENSEAAKVCRYVKGEAGQGAPEASVEGLYLLSVIYLGRTDLLARIVLTAYHFNLLWSFNPRRQNVLLNAKKR